LPFTTIAHDDIKLFAFHLKEAGLDKKIKLVKINLSYKDLDFSWKQSTLKKESRWATMGPWPLSATICTLLKPRPG
jgi:hypothetical protein